MPRSFSRVTAFRHFLHAHDLPLHEIYVNYNSAEARTRYLLLAENVEASFAKPYKRERNALLEYDKLNYPEWYFKIKGI